MPARDQRETPKSQGQPQESEGARLVTALHTALVDFDGKVELIKALSNMLTNSPEPQNSTCNHCQLRLLLAHLDSLIQQAGSAFDTGVIPAYTGIRDFVCQRPAS